MSTALSLAQLTERNAAAAPHSVALIAGESHWTWQRLLGDARQLAAQIPSSATPYVCQGSSLDLARHAYACSLSQRPFWPLDKALTQADSAPEAAALIISTSGSEGQAKAVALSLTNLASAAQAANQRLALGAGDIWLACLPLYHIGGQSILWRCALAGATVLLHERFDTSAIRDDFERYPVSHISLVPAMLARLLEIGIKPPASLRHAIIGGAALSLTLYEKASAAGWPLNPSYGMSESSAQIATWTAADGPWQPGLVGTALGENEISLDSTGRILLRGPQIMLGYLGQNERPENDWFTTGDLGKIDAKSRLTVTGRADDMLISAGRNVHPLEVESCLAACPGVRDVAVTGLPDAVWGDIVVALVVGDASTDEIIRWSTPRLPSAALPRRIIQLASLPRTAAGKLERSTLRHLASEAAA
ncbi:MAG: AMP-binding protein [Rhodocyclaceae bacterium]|nr:AMP-binding protein [Rhodocyclaceae bacterium]